MILKINRKLLKQHEPFYLSIFKSKRLVHYYSLRLPPNFNRNAMSTTFSKSIDQLQTTILPCRLCSSQTVKGTTVYITRIPFKRKRISEDFVIVKTNSEGRVNQGRMVHIEFAKGDFSGSCGSQNRSGMIVICTLQGNKKVS